MVGDMPLILLSGMGADERLFAAQQKAFGDVRLPRWIKPFDGERLSAYAARLAPLVDPGGPCIVGGASFGGIVALELARHLQARACVLISSVRSPQELPWWHRLLTPASFVGPDALALTAGMVAAASGRSLPAQANAGLRRVSRNDAAFLRWASW